MDAFEYRPVNIYHLLTLECDESCILTFDVWPDISFDSKLLTMFESLLPY